MSDKHVPKNYDYKVLLPQLPSAETFAAGEDAITFKSLGTVTARTPDDALEIAAKTHDLPDKTNAVAVAMRNWHEREIAVETRREISTRRPETPAMEDE